jgi:molybdate-binding protein
LIRKLAIYNIPDIQRTIPKLPVVLVHVAQREQGILVAGGNPKSIQSLRDLARNGVRYVNRQPGSGTRVLLDYQLKKLHIDAAAIAGYEREEFTHMAVGVAIASGLADAGLAVRAAAHRFRLRIYSGRQRRIRFAHKPPVLRLGARRRAGRDYFRRQLQTSGWRSWRLRHRLGRNDSLSPVAKLFF